MASLDGSLQSLRLCPMQCFDIRQSHSVTDEFRGLPVNANHIKGKLSMDRSKSERGTELELGTARSKSSARSQASVWVGYSLALVRSTSRDTRS